MANHFEKSGGSYLSLEAAYRYKKLTRPLRAKDNGTLRTVPDARTYMVALSEDRERRAPFGNARDMCGREPRYEACRQRAWDDAGERIIEHLAGLEDFEAAEATYRAAVKKPVIVRDRQGGG